MDMEERYDGVDTINGRDPSAQDIEGMTVDGTLEDVTANSPDFYGSVVTLEGYVGEFVNSYTFSLGENATLDNDLVLVINNSSHPLRADVMVGAKIQVTGRVHPSLEAVNDGVETNFVPLFIDIDIIDDNDGDEMVATEMATDVGAEITEMAPEDDTDATVTPIDGDMSEEDETTDISTTMKQPFMSRNNLVQFAQQGYLPNKYDNYTIIEIVNRDNVLLLEPVED